MSELIEKLKEVRNNGSKRQVHINLANECIKEVDSLQRQLAEAREETTKYKIKYNNQCCEMLRLKQSKKDQTELIRKLKEKVK